MPTSNKQPKDHHYVPICYLKNFAGEDGRMATLNIANVSKGYPTKVKFFHPSQICYIKDFYTITRDIRKSYSGLENYGDYDIESVVLTTLENEYPNLYYQLTRKRILSAKQAAKMADFIIQIKLRNPFWLEKVINKNIGSWTDEFYNEIKDSLTKSPQFSHIPIEIRIQELDAFWKEQKLNTASGRQFQLFSLSQRIEKSNRNNKRVQSAILQYEWVLFIANDGSKFVTTDNPGFTLDANDTHNIKLSGDNQNYFPLSPKYCLMFGDKLDLKYLKKGKQKTISTLLIPNKVVDTVNHLQLGNANRYVIADNETFLEQLKK